MVWHVSTAAASGVLLVVLRYITNPPTIRRKMREIITESSTRSPCFDRNVVYRRTDESSRRGDQTRRVADDAREISAVGKVLDVAHG